MKILKILVLLTILIFLYHDCFADSGITAVDFLNIPIGGRGAVMQSGFVSLADDASATYWNPAGIGRMQLRQIWFMRNTWIENTSHNYWAYVHPLVSGTIGFSVNWVRVNEIQQRSTETLEPEGTFSTSEQAFGVSYAKSFDFSNFGLNLGITSRLIQSKIAKYSARGYAVDVGGQMKYKYSTLGVSLQNLGTCIRFLDESFPLPVSLKIGATQKFPALSGGIFALGVEFRRDGIMKYSFGMECWIFEPLALRTSYLLSPDNINDNKKFMQGFVGGVGLKFSNFSFDYAGITNSNFGALNQFSLGYRF